MWVPLTMAWCILRLQMEVRPPIWRVAVNILSKQSRTADKGWFSSLEIEQGVNNSTVKTSFVANREHLPQTWIDSFV